MKDDEKLHFAILSQQITTMSEQMTKLSAELNRAHELLMKAHELTSLILKEQARPFVPRDELERAVK